MGNITMSPLAKSQGRFCCIRETLPTLRFHPPPLTQRRRSRGVRVGATNDKDDVDWDDSWSKFKDTAKKGIPEVESMRSRPPKFRNGGGVPTRADNIRKQESLLLDAYSSETFFKVAGGLVVAVLVIFVFVIGPP